MAHTRRILAPLAFISIDLSVRGGANPAVVLDSRNDGAELVVPNIALLSWLEQQTGQSISELFEDHEGVKPWDEICSIVAQVCQRLSIDVPTLFGSGAELESGLQLRAGRRGRVAARDHRERGSGPLKLARKAQWLVIHGPPGTGKSQTITNVIGDHLASGERILMVCDIPYDQLRPDTLDALMEEFVTRDGAVHGHADTPLPVQIAAVKRQLRSGKAVIVYVEATESCTIMHRDEAMAQEAAERRLAEEQAQHDPE